MNYRLSLAAAGLLSILMAVLILLEVMLVARPDGREQTFIPAEISPHGGIPQPAGVAPPLLQSWADLALARPIFSPSRRPGSMVAAPTELPRLAGIVIAPQGARAIFASGDARAIVAVPGMRVGPYLIRAVSGYGVAVIGPSGPEWLQPSFDRNAQHDNAQEPTTPPSGGSILDLLRARVQGADGLRAGLLPGLGAPPLSAPQR